jgi:hypothetical protein
VTQTSGRAQVFSTFTACNSFNPEPQYRIRCLFDDNTLIETQTTDARW